MFVVNVLCYLLFNSIDQTEVLQFENFDLDSIKTPVNTRRSQELLVLSQYDKKETEFLVDGFTSGSSIGYNEPEDVKLTSPNLKFREVGNDVILWNKVMKEVKENRYAGPFKEIPFNSYIQSPIGLVPKDNGKDTRLIFHLSYPRGKGLSVNENTPPELCKVKYPDFHEAIQLCIVEGRGCHIAKSDMKSAFRNLGIKKKYWKFLIMKAKSPLDGKIYYFVDKCLPLVHPFLVHISRDLAMLLLILYSGRLRKVWSTTWMTTYLLLI